MILDVAAPSPVDGITGSDLILLVIGIVIAVAIICLVVFLNIKKKRGVK